MSQPESQFTATAGEHFVAYQIAARGFVPALVRQTTRSFDLIAATADGTRTVSLIVKTAVHAQKETSGEASMLEFPFSPRSLQRMTNSALYCFVNLNARAAQRMPDVYVVPVALLKTEYLGVHSPKYLQPRYCRPAAALERFRNNWEPLLAALTAAAGSPLATADFEAEESEKPTARAPAAEEGALCLDLMRAPRLAGEFLATEATG